MSRWGLRWSLWVIALFTVLGLSGCNRRANEVFFPIIIGVATQTPIVLDTPAATITVTSAVTRTITPATTLTPVTTPTSLTPTSLATRRAIGSPIARPPTRVATLVTPTGNNPNGGTRVAGANTAVVATLTPTPQATPTPTAYLNYLALIVSGLRNAIEATATPQPAPIVVTPTARATPTPTITLTPSVTPVDSVVLLARDPTGSSNYMSVVAYAVPDSQLDRSWSSFYDLHPGNSDYARLYTAEGVRAYDPFVALTTTDQWVEGVCTTATAMVGVQFWGDENDGWARVLVDGVERWRGNTYGQSPDLFVRFLSIRDLAPAPHVIRIEPLGQRGSNNPGSNIHVSVYAIVCGLAVRTEIYVPLLLR